MKVVAPLQEDRVRYLTLTIHAVQRSQSRSLRFQLTDPENLLFLFCVSVAEADFSVIKDQQCLNVDFAGFAGKFIDLVELCRANGLAADRPLLSTGGSSADGQSEPLLLSSASSGSPQRRMLVPGRISAVLRMDDAQHKAATLRILEHDELRDVDRFSLSLRAGTDVMLLDYLTGLVVFYRDRCKCLAGDLKETKEQCISLSAECKNLKNDLRVRDEREASALRDAEAVLSAKLNDLREEQTRKLEAMVKTHELEKRGIETVLKEELQAMSSKHADLQKQHLALTEGKSQLELRVRELTSEGASQAKQIAVVTSELESLRTERMSLSRNLSDLQRQFHDMELAHSSGQQQVRGLEQNGATLKELLDSAYKQKDVLEEQSRGLKEALKHKDDKLRLAVGEINKANEILSQRGMLIEQLKQKLSIKAAVVGKQEEAIRGMERIQAEFNSERNSLRLTVDEKTTEIDKLKVQIKKLTDRLEESTKIIEKDEGAIRWLSNQVNELQLQHAGAVSRGRYPASGSGGSTVDALPSFMVPPTAGNVSMSAAGSASTFSSSSAAAAGEISGASLYAASVSTPLQGNVAPSYARGSVATGGLSVSYRPPSDFARIGDMYLSAATGSSAGDEVAQAHLDYLRPAISTK